MARRGRGVEGIEEVVAEGFRRYDQEEGTTIAAEGLGVSEAVVGHGDETITKGCLISRR